MIVITCGLLPVSCRVCCTYTNKLAAVRLVAFTVPHFRHCFLATGRKIQKWKEPLMRLVKWQISYRRRNAPPLSTLALRPNSGLGHLVEVSRSHTVRHTISDRTPLNGWSGPSQRPLPTKHITNTREDINALSVIRTHDPSNQAAADLRLGRRGQRDGWV